MPRISRFGNFPIPTENFYEYFLNRLENQVKQNPDKKAFIAAEDYNNYVTFKGLYESIRSIETYLHNIGFKKDDVALIATPNCWEYIAIYAAIVCRGGILSGASYMFTADELRRQIKDCKAKLIIASDDTLTKIQEARKGLTKSDIILITKQSTAPKGVVPLSDILKTVPKTITRPKINNTKDLVLIPYSSGTTGIPKGVMLSHQNVTSMLEAVDFYYDTHVFPKVGINMSQETICLIMPLYHAYGSNVVINSLLKGVTTVLMKSFDPVLFCKAIQTYKIKVQFLVPPILLFLAKHPLVNQFDLSSLTVIQSGAAPLGAEACEEAKRRLPNLKVLAQGFGMTETTVGCHFLAVTEKPNYTNTGYLAPNMQLKIEDPETGKEILDSRPGEICVKGPNIMVGYLNRPEETKKTIDKDGWLHTGDIGYEDSNGLLYIVDRIKELIKVSGFQVPPAELEDILLSHPQISDAAVIGIPHSKTGEVPKAFVVKSDPKLTATDVQEFVAKKVAYYKHLKGGVEFIKEVPRSLAGKILRKDLKALEKTKSKL